MSIVVNRPAESWWHRRVAIILVCAAVVITVLTWSSEYRSCTRTNSITQEVNKKLATAVGPNRGTRIETLSCFKPLPDTKTPKVRNE